MMYDSFSTSDWLQMIGKEKLQSFQDVFSRTYNISMSFFDMQGKPLTVWSQYPLFCQNLPAPQKSRCKQEKQAMLESLEKTRAIKLLVCPFGLVNLICPIAFAGKLVSYAQCGGVVYENSKIPPALKENFHLIMKTKTEMLAIGELLQETLHLLEINPRPLEACREAVKKAATLERDERLSNREEEITKLICEGLSNKQIGEALFITERTVKTHVSNILSKLNLHDRMQIMAYYYDKERKVAK